MIKQRTVKEIVRIEGVGLQTGKPVSLTIKSAPANSGINFIRTDLPNKPLLNIQSIAINNSSLKERRTTLGAGPVRVETTEHFLAALSGLSVDNIVAELDSAELPGLDGSAKLFVEAIKKARIIEQDAPKKILKVTEPVWCKDGQAMLALFPDDGFTVTYVLSYKNLSIGTEFFSITLNEKNFEDEIAPARTFCLEAEAAELLKRGLGKGANYENTLVIGESGPIKNMFRFPEEPVRHKILDLIGDLYILGLPIAGHVIAIKSGHKLNMELVKRLKEKI